MKIKCLSTLCAATIINLLFFKTSFSQDTQLDETFGIGGIVTTAFNVKGYSNLQATALQSDGKIIAVGTYQNQYLHNDLAVVRFCEDGSLDPTFGSNGIVITSFLSGRNEDAFAVTVQSDGKIVLGGSIDAGDIQSFLIARYKSDGSIDTSFGFNNWGFNVASFGSRYSVIHSLAIQEDGKIIAAGHCLEPKFSFALARFNSNGSMDTTFANSGTVTTDTPVTDNPNAVHTAAIQQDGKIVVGGYYHIARYNEDGSMDSTFGVHGIAELPSNVFSADMSIGADKKIYIGGHNFYDFNLMRYNSNGIPDSTFGTDAMKATVIGESEGSISSIQLQNDGKIVVVGNVGNESYVGIVRYLSNGELDNTFGSDGIYTEKIGNWTASSLLKSDGKLLVAGNIPINESNRCFYVASFNSNGTLNKSFGKNGITRAEIGITSSTIRSIAIQNDGKIVTVGTHYNTTTSKDDLILYRYHLNGILDNSFGTNGIVYKPVDDMRIFYPGSLALQNDGKIVVGGLGNKKFQLIRFNSNGTLDDDFGESGIVFSTIQTSSTIASVLVQKDEKLIAVGNSYLEGHKINFTMARYNQNGSPDISFGENGIQIVRFDTLESRVSSAVLQEDGKIIVGGTMRNEMNRLQFAIVRCNPNGTLDSTFGTDGKVVTVRQASGYITSLGLQKDGKIVAGGTSGSGFALARYKPDGSLDTLSFGINGFALDVADGYIYSEIRSMIIQPDGKIMVTGGVYHGSVGVFSILSYTENGKLDSTFGTKGIVSTFLGLASTAFPYAIAQQNDGKIMLGGTMGRDSYNVNCLARYTTDSNLVGNNDLPEQTGDTRVLDQNFPNPFNRNTIIRYFIPEQGLVALKIYDLTGREIKSLINETQSTGQYEIEFSSEGLSNGIYFYKLSIGTLTESRKMMVVR